MEAVAFLIARAEKQVKLDEEQLAKSREQLKRVREKYGSSYEGECQQVPDISRPSKEPQEQRKGT